jgi:hypothetical protein
MHTKFDKDWFIHLKVDKEGFAYTVWKSNKPALRKLAKIYSNISICVL